MNIKMLGHKTDLFFSRENGFIIDRGDYTVIKTPTNKNYYWGNYIIFHSAPKKEDFKEWKKIFDVEFNYYLIPNHYSFTWDKQEQGEIELFLENGFTAETQEVLTAAKLEKPNHFNEEIEIRLIKKDQDYEDVVNLAEICVEEEYRNEKYLEFKKKQMLGYKKLNEVKKGFWLGAYKESKLVGTLGLYFRKTIARYQNVETHPEFRNKGICSTLLFEAAKKLQETNKIKELVIVSKNKSNASKLYQSLGFKKKENQFTLSWIKKEM